MQSLADKGEVKKRYHNNSWQYGGLPNALSALKLKYGHERVDTQSQLLARAKRAEELVEILTSVIKDALIDREIKLNKGSKSLRSYL